MHKTINITFINRQCFALVMTLFIIAEVSSIYVDSVAVDLIEVAEFGESKQETENKEENIKEDLYSDSNVSAFIGITSSQVRYYHNLQRSVYYQSIPTPPPDRI